MGTKRSVRIENVGGIREFEFDLEPGIVELRGPNGIGKTCALRAATRAFGGEVQLEPRDGTDEGHVETSDGVHLIVRANTKTTGKATVSLADVGPLADLVDPQIKDEKARAARRVAALLEIVRVPVDEDTIQQLAGDPVVAGVALKRCRDEFIDDVLSASDRTRRTAHDLAREAEAGAEQARGRANSHEILAADALRALGGRDRLLETWTPEEAEAQERDLARQFETARVTARQRQELEQRQAEVRASLGERPDPSRFDHDRQIRAQAVAAADMRYREIEEQLRELERKLGQQKETMAAVRADLIAIDKAKESEQERLRTYERQATILDQPVTGPTPADVETLRAKVEEAQDRTVRARHSADYHRNRDAEAAARQDAKERDERAETLRELAKSVRDRLGDLLEGTPAQGFAVVDGRLHVNVPGLGLVDFETRRSEGERLRHALAAWAAANRGAVAPIDGKLYATLQPAVKLEAAQAAAELGLTLLTEVPTDGAELTAVQVPTHDVELAAVGS